MKTSVIDVPRKHTQDDLFGIQVYQNADLGPNIEKIFKEIFDAYGLPNIKFVVKQTEECNLMNRVGVLRLR